jgi:hypothetical protein
MAYTMIDTTRDEAIFRDGISSKQITGVASFVKIVGPSAGSSSLFGSTTINANLTRSHTMK